MKRRIIFSIVAVTVVALLVLGVPLALAVARLYRSEEVLRLEREANEARSSVSTSELARGEPIDLADEGTTRFVIYDQHGRRVGGAGPDRGDSTVRKALDGDSADARRGSRIVVAVPINGDEQVVGALRASRPDAVVADRTRSSWLVMLAIAIGAVIVAAVLAWWQARRLTRPIDALVDTARSLGGGDFSVRTDTSGIEELDQLGSALNTTADRLGNLVARERAFSADASHQLRTPIAGLRVNVESALLEPDTDARAALAAMLPPIDRLEATVEDLLRLARDADVERSPLDAVALLREAEGHWSGALAAQDRALRVVVEDALPAPGRRRARSAADPRCPDLERAASRNRHGHRRGTLEPAGCGGDPGR